MRNLIFFNLFLFLICFAFNSHAACEAGQMTTLVDKHEVSRINSKTGQTKITLLTAGTKVHVTTIEDNKAGIYAMHGSNGEYISATSTVNLDGRATLKCQGS